MERIKSTRKKPNVDAEKLGKDELGQTLLGYYTPRKTPSVPTPAEREVRQPNELTRALYRCSGTAQKIFVLVAERFMRTMNTRNDRWVDIDLTNIITDLHTTDGQNTREVIKKAIKEVADLSVFLRDDDKMLHYIHLFEEAKLDWDEGVLQYKPTERFATFLEFEQHKQGYSVFSIDIVSRLSSFYAMRYFEIAMSYYGFKGRLKEMSPFADGLGLPIKHTWFFAYDVAHLRALFDIKDDEYKVVNDLIKKVVRSPIEELNKKQARLTFNVEVRRRNNTQRGRVEGFIFWVTENEPGERVTHKLLEGREERTLYNEINAEKQEVADFKNRYPEEFYDEMAAIRRENGRLQRGLPMFQILNEAEAVKRLKARGFKV